MALYLFHNIPSFHLRLLYLKEFLEDHYKIGLLFPMLNSEDLNHVCELSNILEVFHLKHQNVLPLTILKLDLLRVILFSGILLAFHYLYNTNYLLSKQVHNVKIDYIFFLGNFHLFWMIFLLHFLLHLFYMKYLKCIFHYETNII